MKRKRTSKDSRLANLFEYLAGELENGTTLRDCIQKTWVHLGFIDQILPGQPHESIEDQYDEWKGTPTVTARFLPLILLEMHSQCPEGALLVAHSWRKENVNFVMTNKLSQEHKDAYESAVKKTFRLLTQEMLANPETADRFAIHQQDQLRQALFVEGMRFLIDYDPSQFKRSESFTPIFVHSDRVTWNGMGPPSSTRETWCSTKTRATIVTRRQHHQHYPLRCSLQFTGKDQGQLISIYFNSLVWHNWDVPLRFLVKLSARLHRNLCSLCPSLVKMVLGYLFDFLMSCHVL